MRAVFVFCEGAHDVTFVTRSLGRVANARWLGDPIGQLPSPLGPIPDPAQPARPKLESLIARRHARRTLDELRLQEAAHAPLPAFEAIVQAGETLYVLMRCHGDGAARASIELLDDVDAVLAFGTRIKQIAAAFLFDADASVETRAASFATEYAALFGAVEAPGHDAWVRGRHRVGLHVFHDEATGGGTLEELLAPLVAAQWGARWAGAHDYLDTHADPGDPVSVKRSERLKAQINVTGQFLFPGDPMSIVLARRGLDGEHFGGPASQALVSFLQRVPW